MQYGCESAAIPSRALTRPTTKIVRYVPQKKSANTVSPILHSGMLSVASPTMQAAEFITIPKKESNMAGMVVIVISYAEKLPHRQFLINDRPYRRKTCKNPFDQRRRCRQDWRKLVGCSS